MAREKKDFLAFEISPVHRSTVSDKTNAPTDRRDGRLTAARRSRNEAAERLVKALGHAIASSFSGEHQQNTEDVCRRLLLSARAAVATRVNAPVQQRRGACPDSTPRRPSTARFRRNGENLFLRLSGSRVCFRRARRARSRAPRRARRPSPGQRLRRLASLLPCEPIPRLVRPLRPSRARPERPPSGARVAPVWITMPRHFFAPRGLSSRASSPAFDPED